MRYSKWDGSAWATTIIDDDADVYAVSSLAFDLLGNPTISYLGEYTEPMYAHWNGRRWRVELVDDARTIVDGPSPHLLLRSPDNRLTAR